MTAGENIVRRFSVPVAILSFSLAACGPAVAEAPAAPPAKPAPSAPSAPKTKAVTVLGDYDEEADAAKDVKDALSKAKKDGKPVLVDVGADWCPDCVVLRKLAAKPEVSPLLKEFHVVSVDVGEFDHNLDVAEDLTVDLRSSGIPALVVLSPKGKVRTVTNDGSFASARSMSADDVATFLKKWK
ncbi:thioredoxin family protein [Actinoplanes sp. TFC3]|uniref:thioredoxin family protein n=1 Tax=Actinoplanes sp. TFC3 TaxID=1710355 RepID=UPI0009E7E604|nr:thioredoxin family protein [Actinoplanes sp. TFC3]